MHRIALALALLAMLSIPTPAWAQTTCSPAQLVGFTATTLPGDAGVLATTAQCQIDFGVTARMCESREVLETVVVPALVPAEAWILPSFQPIGSGDVAGLALDASGRSARPDRLTCDGWSSTAPTGLVIDEAGRFRTGSCSTPRAIACCAPVALPEPSSAVSLGAGGAALAALARLRR